MPNPEYYCEYYYAGGQWELIGVKRSPVIIVQLSRLQTRRGIQAT